MPLSASHWGRKTDLRSGIRILCCGLALVGLAATTFAQQPAAVPGAKPAPATAAAKPAAPVAPQLISPAADPATFLTLPYDEGLKKEYKTVFAVLGVGKVSPDQEQSFVSYYGRYSMGRWTIPANYTSLPKFRNDLRKDLQKAKIGDAHTRLNDLIFQGMSKVATGNYHPVVRVNAMLMIGELNSEDPARETPVPYHQAVPAFLQVIDDPQQLDAVKAAALVGLVRHVRLGLRDDVRDSVGASMLNLAKAASAPGRTPEGHAWMRGEASEILGVLRSIGNANTVANALGQIAGDPTAPMTVRRAAARALGKLNYQIAVSLNGSALAAAVARFTITAAETAQAETEQGKTTPCRRFKGCVIAAAEGINGLAESLKDPAQEKYAASVRESIAKLNKVCERGDDRAILQQAAVTTAELRKLVEKVP